MKYFPVLSLFFLIFLFSCSKKDKGFKKVAKSAEFIYHPEGYIGDQNCVECHKKEYANWKGSHHDLAMQVATDSTVLGNFNDFSTVIDKVGYHFYKKGSDFFVDIKEIDGTEKNYQIKYTFGFTPLQQYLVDFNKGRKQTLRVTWDTVKNKWYHQYKDQVIQPDDWLHWTRGAQNWNTMCAECHSTNLKKDYFVEKDSFHTTYSRINVSCESCHGPGEDHVNWANNGGKDGKTYILHSKDQQKQINECAPCHSRRAKLTKNLVPGLEFYDQYMLQTINSNYYYPDGQINDEDYVVGSFLQSNMYANKVKCTDCHDPHSMQLKFQGNTLCLQCHIKKDYDTPKHHFHKENTEASQCINCHMTGKNYMGNDFRRDHSFRIPRPDQSEKYGTPNACNGCHKDKSVKWAVKSINTWYGKKRRDHFSDALLLTTKNELTQEEKNKINSFIADYKYPYIARATAIENMDISTEKDFNAVMSILNDSSALVRYNALARLRFLPLEERSSVALQHITDSVKLVRIGAAQLLFDLDINTLDETNRTAIRKARDDYEKMLYASADFSTGRMQLGDYFLRKNELKKAIVHYKMALEMDSLLFPVYGNLATAYSMLADNRQALKTLNLLIGLDPKNARAYYLRALLHFEMKEDEKAISDFNKAVEINPNDSRSYYNLATYYYQKRLLILSAKNIRKALKIEPENRDYQYLLALIYQGLGNSEGSKKIMDHLQKTQNQ